jgi:hypothetical protein
MSEPRASESEGTVPAATDVATDAATDVAPAAGPAAAPAVRDPREYLARALQVGGVVLIGVSTLKTVMALGLGATTTQSRLGVADRYAVGIGVLVEQQFMLGLVVASALALAPWLFRRSPSLRAAALTRIALLMAAVLAIIGAVVATLNVRVQIAFRPQVNNALKFQLAGYLVQMLGLAVIVVLGAAVGMGIVRARTAEIDTGETAAD